MEGLKTTYVYLNKYLSKKDTEYFYVGSHTWVGPIGVVDPTYVGSSRVALRCGWTPYKTTILEVCSEETKKFAEKYWIEHYCNLYGIADVAIGCARSDWHRKFPAHGKMLNLHSNGTDQMRTKQAMLKNVETRRNNGTLSHPHESYQRAVLSKRERGVKIISDKCRQSAASKETRRKAIETLKNNNFKSWLDKTLRTPHSKESYNKGISTKREHAKKCRLGDGFVGRYFEISEHTGIAPGTVGNAMTSAFRRGAYKCKGVWFYPIY